MTYGDTIRAARKARGKTIAAVAQSAGVSMLHLWGVETNRHRPSASLVVRLARVLDIDPLAALEESGALEQRPVRKRSRAGRSASPQAQHGKAHHKAPDKAPDKARRRAPVNAPEPVNPQTRRNARQNGSGSAMQTSRRHAPETVHRKAGR